MALIVMLLCLTCLLMPGHAANVLCSDHGPLGMENKAITDDQITASSFYDYLPPKEGRLQNYKFWATEYDMPSEHWIQVDFLDVVNISGIETQGGVRYTEWVTELQIQIGYSENSLAYIMQGTKPKQFTANTDTNSIARIMFPDPIITRYLRIVPTDWHNWVAMRFEVIGCRNVRSTTTYSTSSPTTVSTSKKGAVINKEAVPITRKAKSYSTSQGSPDIFYPSISPSNDDKQAQESTSKYPWVVIGAGVGSFIVILLFVFNALCLWKLRSERKENQTAASTAKPMAFDGPYDLTISGTTPNQQSGSIISKQPQDNQENPFLNEVYQEIPISSTADDPTTMYYTLVGSKIVSIGSDEHMSNIHSEPGTGNDLDLKDRGSVNFSTTNTPKCVGSEDKTVYVTLEDDVFNNEEEMQTQKE